jgi:hydrogenase expression/formation protein HypD
MNRYIEAALNYRGRPLTLMEVCGTHTMAIARYGLRQILPPDIRLLPGPRCLGSAVLALRGHRPSVNSGPIATFEHTSK